jgi:FixJ family two-component response regulator
MFVSARRFFAVVVDDDESVRESLPDLLKVLGFESVAFDSAEALLSSHVLDRVDCLIVDIAMPGMSGTELMRHPAVVSRGIPVIVITALPEESIRREILAAGAAECLLKPFSESALLEALRAVLGGSGMW